MVMRKKILKAFYRVLEVMTSDRFLKWSTAIESVILMACIDNILHLTNFINVMLILGLIILVPIVMLVLNIVIGMFILSPIESVLHKKLYK